MRFRLLAGVHCQADGVYHPGDEFDSSVDLVARFGKVKFRRIDDSPPVVEQAATAAGKDGAAGGRESAAPLSSRAGAAGSPPAPPPPPSPVHGDGWASLTMADLRALAEVEEIELPARASKDQVIAILRKAGVEPVSLGPVVATVP